MDDSTLLRPEPADTTMLRGILVEDWNEAHPEADPETRINAHLVIGETVDQLRNMWGEGVFDAWVASADAWINYVKSLPVVADLELL